MLLSTPGRRRERGLPEEDPGVLASGRSRNTSSNSDLLFSRASGALRCGSCRRGAAGSAATSERSSQHEKRDPEEKLNYSGRHLSGKILSSTSPPPMRTPPAARGARVPASQDDHEPTSSEAEREVTTRLHAGGHPRMEPLVQRTRDTCKVQRRCTATACGWKYTYESLWNAITNTIRVRIYCTIRPQISARPFIAYPQVLFM